MRTALGIMLLSVLAAIVVIVLEPGGARYHRHDLVAFRGTRALIARLEPVARS